MSKYLMTFAEVIKTVKMITNRKKSDIITNRFDTFSSIPKATNIVCLTQEEYEELGDSADSNTLYLTF